MVILNGRGFLGRICRGLCLLMAMSLALPAVALAQPRHGHHDRYRSLPHGHHRYHHGGRNYYYHGGHYYHHRGGYYYRTRPPRGFFLNVLPFAAAAVVLGGLTYYTYNGIYYQQTPGGYMVVDPPPGAVVSAPPPVVMADPAPYAVGGMVVVTIPTLNVRSGPGAHYPAVAVVNQGQQMPVRGGAAGWLNVQMPNGLWGWVAQKYTVPVAGMPQG